MTGAGNRSLVVGPEGRRRGDGPLREFEGTERFRVQRKLGSGTTGAVYEVYDRQRQSIVALKVLRQVDPAALYRFKQEFRALADVSHRNLVQLYELLSDGEHWFFTMELVRGRTWTEYLRGTDPTGESPSDDRTPTLIRLEDSGEITPESTLSPEEELAQEVGESGLPCPPEQLRDALRQLAHGLDALHGAGKLHRDLKPSNVLVRRDGRLVLLDLGLVRDLVSQRIYESLNDDIVGTPAFMSPEQAAGLRVDEASDWYSVGVMLYEILT
ncbi:MAG: serine/threonine protein kinase, partial [Acidobacteria bacterium]|nr:serine/threonine protein kinase [Acidobacteriota bacterium]